MKGMKTITLLLMIASFVLGGCRSETEQTTVLESTTASPTSEGEQGTRILPPARGAAEPLVVVTTFEDFECPFCSRVGQINDRLLEYFPDDVQIQFRNYPLAFHPLATPTARAALAAGKQGKFWSMYDLLFKRQAKWAKQHISARITKVDWADDGETATITLDRGNPGCVIAEGSKSGTCKYNENVTCTSKIAPECAAFGIRGSDTGRVGRRLLFKVTDVGESESIAIVGSNKSLTTEFWERGQAGVAGKGGWIQKGLPTDRMRRLLRTGDDVEIVRAGRANDEVFTQELIAMAESLGLDAAQFESDLRPKKDGDAIGDRIKQDLVKAQRSGARGTPTILVNGRKVQKGLEDKSLTQPVLRLVREEIRKAKLLLDKGTARVDIPMKLAVENISSKRLASWLIEDTPVDASTMALATPRPRQPKEILSKKTAALNYSTAAPLGPANAPHKVTVFSDFECPYCSKIAKPLHDLVKLADGKVAVYFKHFPLGFHRRAKPAAIASYCGQKQGKFWEFHDAIFENPRALTDEDLKGHAQKLGLNLVDWEACIADSSAAAAVDADMAEGKKAGVRGTPTLMFNGRTYQGDRSAQGMLGTVQKLESGQL